MNNTLLSKYNKIKKLININSWFDYDRLHYRNLSNTKFIPHMMIIDHESFKVTWSYEFFRDRIRSYPELCYGLFYDDIEYGIFMIGFICGKVENNGDIILSKIAILRKFRGFELSKMMLNAFITDVKIEYPMSKKIKLDVRESNAPAKRLYDKVGFYIVDESRYSDGEKGLVYQFNLN